MLVGQVVRVFLIARIADVVHDYEVYVAEVERVVDRAEGLLVRTYRAQVVILGALVRQHGDRAVVVVVADRVEECDVHVAEQPGDLLEHRGVVCADVAQRDGDAGQRLRFERAVDVGDDLVGETLHVGLRFHLRIAHGDEYERPGGRLVGLVEREILALGAFGRAVQPAEEVGYAVVVALYAAVFRVGEEYVAGIGVTGQLIDSVAVGDGRRISVADDDALGRAVVRISDAAYQVAALLDFDAEASARTSLLVRGGTCDGYVQKRSQ